MKAVSSRTNLSNDVESASARLAPPRVLPDWVDWPGMLVPEWHPRIIAKLGEPEPGRDLVPFDADDDEPLNAPDNDNHNPGGRLFGWFVTALIALAAVCLTLAIIFGLTDTAGPPCVKIGNVVELVGRCAGIKDPVVWPDRVPR